jgi:hypothetical protein
VIYAAATAHATKTAMAAAVAAAAATAAAATAAATTAAVAAAAAAAEGVRPPIYDIGGVSVGVVGGGGVGVRAMVPVAAHL